jgi:hypothetical protein
MVGSNTTLIEEAGYKKPLPGGVELETSCNIHTNVALKLYKGRVSVFELYSPELAWSWGPHLASLFYCLHRPASLSAHAVIT